jgi:hypothetical protein
MNRTPCEPCAAIHELLLTFAISDDGKAVDEAFLWEARTDRLPLITFGQMRRLLEAVRTSLPPNFDQMVAIGRAVVERSEFR